MSADLRRRLAAEALGTWLLVAAVIGSGIMAERLAGGNVAIALIGNTLATGAVLYVLIEIFGPVSGAHFNPAVTLVFLIRREISLPHAALYVPVQFAGGALGAVAAHFMFSMPLIEHASHVRDGAGQLAGEAIATFTLVLAILGAVAVRPKAVAAVVALTIVAGYWFTSSTSFANPAVTFARTLTDSFSGIRFVDMPGFMAAQVAGALLAAIVGKFIWPRS